MKWYGWLMAVGLLGLNSCVIFPLPRTIHGLTPVYPKASSVNTPTADDLKPTFRWQPAPEANVTYDLIIYEMIGESVKGQLWGEIKEVYYRQGIMMPEHQIEEPLQPNTGYYWSVRVHREAQVSDWSRFDIRWCVGFIIPLYFGVGTGGGCPTIELPFFMFTTPSK